MPNGDWGDICFIPSTVAKSDMGNYFIPLGDMNTLNDIYQFIPDKSYNGTVYGIANGGNADGVAYNKKVFEAAGYTKDNMPATPSQFMQALRDIKAKTDAIPLYTNFADKWPMGAWDAYIAVAATGDQDFRNYKIVHTANPFADRGDETGPYAVYSILYNAVAEGLVEADPMSSDWEGSKGMINRGEIGAMVLGSWAVQQFKEAGDNPDDVAYMPFPITVTDADGNRVTSAGGNYSYAINCKTSADQQIASLLYVKWLLNGNVQSRTPTAILFNIFKYLFLIIASIVAILPVVVCVLTAFKTNEEYQMTSPLQLPASFGYLTNFVEAWDKANMLQGFLNTGIVLLCVLALSIFFSATLAYVLNRFKFPGNGLINVLFTFASLIPGIATQVTVYQIMYSLGLINHLYGYIIVLCGTDIISIYIFLQFFENLSPSLDESAILDGCSYFGVFFRILFPLLKPAIVTSCVLKGVSVYNEYYMSNLYLTKDYLKTISTALYAFVGPYGSQYNYICAGVFITIIPALVIFILCQDQIYSGMAAGAGPNNRAGSYAPLLPLCAGGGVGAGNYRRSHYPAAVFLKGDRRMPKLNLDNPVFRTMGRLGDVVLLNLLWAACCVPIVTAGASTTALLAVARKMAAGDDYRVWKNFFQAFRRNWKQATALWLLLAAAGALFLADVFLAYRMPGGSGNFLRGTGIGLCLIWLTAAGNAFALVARYEYTPGRVLRDALYLAAQRPLSALVTIGSALWLPLLWRYDLAAALYVLLPWALVGGAVWAVLLSASLLPVFRKIEEDRNSGEAPE